MKFLHYTFLSILTLTASLSGCSRDTGNTEPTEEETVNEQNRINDELEQAYLNSPEYIFRSKMNTLDPENICLLFPKTIDFETLNNFEDQGNWTFGAPRCSAETFFRILLDYPEVKAYLTKNGFTAEDFFILTDPSVTQYRAYLEPSMSNDDLHCLRIEIYCHVRDKALDIGLIKLPHFPLKPRYCVKVTNN